MSRVRKMSSVGKILDFKERLDMYALDTKGISVNLCAVCVDELFNELVSVAGTSTVPLYVCGLSVHEVKDTALCFIHHSEGVER